MERLEAVLALQKRDRKLDAVLSDFPDGFAAGWHVAVPSCFRDALDIVWRKRSAASEAQSLWVQGGAFDFKRGDTLYDTASAYESWDAARESVHFGLVVTDATPAVPAKPADVAPETPEASRATRAA